LTIKKQNAAGWCRRWNLGDTFATATRVGPEFHGTKGSARGKPKKGALGGGVVCVYYWKVSGSTHTPLVKKGRAPIKPQKKDPELQTQFAQRLKQKSGPPEPRSEVGECGEGREGEERGEAGGGGGYGHSSCGTG